MSNASLSERVGRIGEDRTSGASEIAVEILDILATALDQAEPIEPLGGALIRAQPSMAPVWNAVRAAVMATDAEAFRHYARQVARAPSALVRHAVGLMLTGARGVQLKLITLSFSGTVLFTLQRLAQQRPVQVSCADGQPGLEGRRMAEQLALAGIAVVHYTDAALAHAIDDADAVVVGADAVSPDWFMNKIGSRMLAAAAAQQGVPVYVLATRNKFLSRAIAARLSVREEPAAEIWPIPPAGVTVRNPYFEPTPLDLVAAVISDAGVLGAALMPDACPTAGDELLIDLAPRPT